MRRKGLSLRKLRFMRERETLFGRNGMKGELNRKGGMEKVSRRDKSKKCV